MVATLRDYVAGRLKAIQKRHNFDPSVGALQVQEYPKLKPDFAVFRELLKINAQFQLEVPVPYDPAGLDLQKSCTLEAKPVFVYFARTKGRIWKIGRSGNLPQRTKDVQTSNADHVKIVHKIPCKDVADSRKREKQVHRYFRKLKTRDRNDDSKGEWFEITVSEVKATVKRLKANEWDWLMTRRPTAE